MPVLHRAIAVLALTTLVLSLIFVAQQIAFNSLISTPVSAPRMAARTSLPRNTIATSATSGHAVARVIGVARPAPAAPPKKQNL
jgi:hypothetical protein